MNIDLVINFYKWLLILNISFILIFYILLSFGFNFIYMVTKKSNFMGTKEELNRMMWKIYIQYRLLCVFFVFLPFITLLIIKN